MNDMIEFILGTAVGVGGMIVKDKYLGNTSEQQLNSKQKELDSLYAENEKFRKRNKEMERQIEDLLSENQKLKRSFKDNDDLMDDLKDSLSRSQKEVNKLRLQNDELCRNIQEYKEACEHYKMEIDNLKSKLG
ncbi:MAG: hypothetical protein PUJ18_13695 [Phocaeicola plebeius]|jgi:chromosome segregation ATPase|nr:hypothetical protein [Phocaeicola plebeius]